MSDKSLALKRKVQKEHPTFTEGLDSLSLEELEKKISTYAQHRERVEMEKKEDEDLNSAKENVAELNGPYKDALNAIKMKSSYLYLLIKDKKEEIGLDG